MKPGSSALLVGLIACAVAAPIRAQGAVSARFGENADAATGVSSGPAFAVSGTYFFGRNGIMAGLGTPLDPAGGSRWGSAAAWLDRALPFLDLGVAGTAQGFGYHDPVLDATGGAGSADLQAYRDLDAGPVHFRVRAGGRVGALSTEAGTFRRVLAGGGSDATLPAGSFLLRASMDVWAAEEGTYPEISAAAVWSRNRVKAHARVSRWLHGDLPDAGWSVGAEVAVTERLAIIGHAARPTTDILFFSPAQRSLSIGLRFGPGAPPPPALPAPAFAAPGERVRLEVSVEAAGEEGPLRVAGGFNGWEPAPMRHEGDHWVIELSLERGVHEFAFVRPDGSWFVPEETPGRKADGFGGYVATVVVR